MSVLTDAEWRKAARLLPPANKRGRKRAVDPRVMLSAIMHCAENGSWRSIPASLANWRTAYAYFRIWKAAGALTAIQEALPGRKVIPSS